MVEVGWVAADVLTYEVEPGGFDLVGPRDPGVLYTPEEVVAELDGLRIDKAERVRRPVDEATAIDTLVRATRYPGGYIEGGHDGAE